MDPLDTVEIENEAARRADAAALAARTEIDDVKWLMANKRGRRIANRLLQQAGVFRLSFSTNALQMSFNEGNRNSGLRFLAMLTEHCPERYAEMLKEANQ
ncbi:Bbp19 family protein [Aquitalea palustris]|nr:endopeptidase [Aquitalea palustris]